MDVADRLLIAVYDCACGAHLEYPRSYLEQVFKHGADDDDVIVQDVRVGPDHACRALTCPPAVLDEIIGATDRENQSLLIRATGDGPLLDDGLVLVYGFEQGTLL